MKFIKKITALLLVASVLCFQVPANITSADEAATVLPCVHRLADVAPRDEISTYTHTVVIDKAIVTCTVTCHTISSVKECMICHQTFSTPYTSYEVHSIAH